MKVFVNALIFLLAISVTLILGELVLGLFGFERGLGSIPEKPQTEYHEACKYNTVDELIDAGLIKGRLGRLKPDNDLGYTHYTQPHGFSDRRNFYHDYSDSKRVLMLGDSFTKGNAADSGKGYVALLTKAFEDRGIVFFNTAVGGYGQNNQLRVLEKYLDVIKPHMVLLGFYTGNDFENNLTGLDRFTALPGKWISNYEVIESEDGAIVRRRSSTEILRLYKQSIRCPDQDYGTVKEALRDRVLLRTRIGTLLLIAWRQFKRTGKADDSEHQSSYEVTSRILKQMKDRVHRQGGAFYCLVIPDYHESTTHLVSSKKHRKALKFLEELGIPYLDPFDKLTLRDYERSSGGHWNNSGHRKMFELVKQCFGEDSDRNAIRFCLDPDVSEG